MGDKTEIETASADAILVAKSINKLAAALDRGAEAILTLAAAMTGEFDEPDEPQTYMDGTPLA